MLHVPAYPTGQHLGECLDKNTEERSAFWAILERYNVTAVFSGHEHNYCRKAIENSYQKPIYHITTGGAGSPLNKRADDIKDVIIGPAALHHFIIVDVDYNEVSLKVYDKDNILIDCCSLIPHREGSLSDFPADILIPVSAMWKYFDDGFDRGTSWREPEFDDTNWSKGLAGLVYGKYRRNRANGHKRCITTYFRKQFGIVDVSIYKNLTLRIQRDDGAVVYLNSEEVYRTNMPSGTIEYNTLASRAVSKDGGTSFEKVEVDAKYLREGKNVIAVEVHKASGLSPGISFNLQLLGHKNIEGDSG